MLLLNQIISGVRDSTPRSLAMDYPEAGILVPVTRSDTPEIIFTKRSDNLATHTGQVAFPGGKKDDTDPGLEYTALRESHEEIDLPPQSVEVVGQLSQVVSRFGILVTPFVGLIDPHQPLKPNPEELDSIFTVPVTHFLDNKPDRIDRLGFRNIELHVPCYLYKGYEIWGLSSIVLVDFLNVSFNAGISILRPPAKRTSTLKGKA